MQLKHNVDDGKLQVDDEQMMGKLPPPLMSRCCVCHHCWADGGKTITTIGEQMMRKIPPPLMSRSIMRRW